MNDQQYSPSGFTLLPVVTKNLLIINGLMYLASLVAAKVYNLDLNDILGLHYFASSKFMPYQFITYMFMHGSFSHIFFNMFALWMFGGVLEQAWGPKKYLFYYFFAGIGAAIFHYVVFYFQISPSLQVMNNFLAHPDLGSLQQLISTHKFGISDTGDIADAFERFKSSVSILQAQPTDSQALQTAVSFISEYRSAFLNAPVVIGASGAIYGLLLAFGMMFPNALIYVYFFIPMKAKWFVIIYGIIELASGFLDTGGNVAHFAHLGGMLFGLILILYWRKKERMNQQNNYWQ